MVFGTPTTLMPSLWSLFATPSVSSPPIAMRKSQLNFFRFALTCSGPFSTL